MTFSIMTLSRKGLFGTLSIMTLIRMGLFGTISMNDV
jgi:hypothetical protein